LKRQGEGPAARLLWGKRRVCWWQGMKRASRKGPWRPIGSLSFVCLRLPPLPPTKSLVAGPSLYLTTQSIVQTPSDLYQALPVSNLPLSGDFGRSCDVRAVVSCYGLESLCSDMTIERLSRGVKRRKEAKTARVAFIFLALRFFFRI
jgi:hypothetical protein